jgi:hypothetical protein
MRYHCVSHEDRLKARLAPVAAPSLGAAEWLGLAAAPTFAIMALLTGVLGGGPQDMLCAAGQDASALGGMVPMYMLMSAFHSAPWLQLISRRRRSSGARPRQSRHRPERTIPAPIPRA